MVRQPPDLAARFPPIRKDLLKLPNNPFEVTKAVDFTDEQINATWVDLPGGGFSALASPKSPMPKFLVGGKGGGRTHLLRYYSYPLQRLRHAPDPLAGIREEGYLGIYFRCTGLNSARFSEKGSTGDIWGGVFAYYTDVWLAQLAVETISDLLGLKKPRVGPDLVHRFVQGVLSLFDVPPLGSPQINDIAALGLYLRSLQRSLDVAINNSALRRTLEVELAASPGRLVFGIPKLAATLFPELADVRVAYLIDEFENLTEEQQKYINTLIREKELPSTFLVGSRLWGIRTHATFSAGEENRQGSEFDRVLLEEAYSATSHKYETFCADIVQRRLDQFGVRTSSGAALPNYFDVPEGTYEERSTLLAGLLPQNQRPWMISLERHLTEAGVQSDHRQQLSEELSFPQEPLFEKLALLFFYRGWADGVEFQEAASSARLQADSARSPGKQKLSKALTTYRHYKEDLFAQLLAALAEPQDYVGFPTFVRMSGFLPRNLLIVLKQVTRWSTFLDEEPFRGGPISLAAQREGVREASEWFLADSKGLGKLGADTQTSIRRLGSYLQAQRFSDKPVEPSCATFETDRGGLTERAVACLDEAVSHSLLIEVPGGRRDKNTRVLHYKYQLNPMLAPLFNLPVARRGVANFSAVEMISIFDPGVPESELAKLRRRRLAALNAPFRAEAGVAEEHLQAELDI